MARRILLVVFALVLLAAVGVAVAGGVGRRRMRGLFETEATALAGRARERPPVVVDPARVATLPPPVQRYLEVTGAVTSPGFRVARLEQRGELRSGAGREGMPFVAEQVYAADPPGFTWFATLRMAPMVSGAVRDRYTGGEGAMLVKVLGLMTMVDARGPELDQGAALRFWGEMFAFPEMVTHPAVAWEPIDDRTARVRIVDGPLMLDATVGFDDDGFLASFRAQRYRDVNGTGVLTDWSGRMIGRRRFADRWFPARWVSTWHLAEGDLEAVTMEITGVRVE
jgi:hypothetical protein